MTRGPQVEDGPPLYRVGICFGMGGGRMRQSKINIGIYFIVSYFVRP
jgi:hypothetical protein